jgi:valyl-tRNA synthetase
MYAQGRVGASVLTNEFVSVFVHVQSDREEAILLSQTPTIVTLTKGCTSAKVVRDLKDIPAGCGSSVLTPTVAVHVLVRVS